MTIETRLPWVGIEETGKRKVGQIVTTYRQPDERWLVVRVNDEHAWLAPLITERPLVAGPVAAVGNVGSDGH
jgi:hypothetical protein